MFIELSPHFKWFDHTFSHIQVHKFDDPTEVIHQMQLSKQFAEVNGSLRRFRICKILIFPKFH